MTGAASPLLLPGFEYRRVDVDGVTISCAIRGSGPPALLLHGYPENHLIWRDVAPVLAESHTVVLADLRGYGQSDKPVPDPAGLAYSKRSMARDQVGLMRKLGFSQFDLVCHDRGARVGHRLALDYPDAVTTLTVLDIVPSRHVFHHMSQTVALADYHWFFLAAGNGIPEHMISGDPGYWIRALMGQLLGEGATIAPEVMDDYIRCFQDPATVAGSCADYRASLGPDLADDDEAFAAGQKVKCPLHVLWGTGGMVEPGSDPLGIWRQYATDVSGSALPTGHFVPEEAPESVSTALLKFMAA